MRRWLSNVLRLGIKEIASLKSDKVLAIFIVYSFSISVYSIATGIKTDVANAPVAIIDADRSALSARIADGFLKPYFRRPAAIDRADTDRLMDLGAYTFVLPYAWRAEGRLTLVGEVNPGGRIAECEGCERNSRFALSDIPIKVVPGLEVNAVEIDYTYPGTDERFAGPDLTSGFERVRDILPLEARLFRVGRFPRYDPVEVGNWLTTNAEVAHGAR